MIHPTNFKITQGFANDFRYYLSDPKEWKNKWYYKEVINNGLKGHNGIDYGCPVKSKLVAPCDLEITGLDGSDTSGYGISLWARTKSWEEYGKTYVYEMIFGHLTSFAPGLKVGSSVRVGDYIALSGNSGKYTVGPHLHWGVRKLVKSGSSWNVVDYNNGFYGYFDQMKLIDYKESLNFLDDRIVYSGKQIGASHYLFSEGKFKWLQDEYDFAAGGYIFSEAIQIPAEFIHVDTKALYKVDWSSKKAKVAKQLMELLVYNNKRAQELYKSKKK